MLMYRHQEQRHVEASPERVFAILSDVAHHDQLAGSREVKAIRVLSEGDMHVGSEWEADEEITMGRKRVLSRVHRGRKALARRIGGREGLPV